jgi:hypothetical protein
VSAAKVENVVEIVAARREATGRHEGIVHRLEIEHRVEIDHRVHKETVHRVHRGIDHHGPRENAPHAGAGPGEPLNRLNSRRNPR